jgi:ABC-type glycerol-3-phosphate transport system permease component
MASETETEAPHIAAPEQLARGEEPAIGHPIAPAVPGRGAGARIGKLLLYVLLLAIAFFYFLPFFWSLSTSFKTLPESVKGFDLIPNHPTLAGYPLAFTTGSFDH